jgi:hypothetical protein
MRTDADRVRLVRGWSGFEGLSSPRPFCWIEGTSAKVNVGPIRRAGTAVLTLEAWPYAPPGHPPQRMKLWLNSAFLAEWTMPPDLTRYELRFPARLFSKGPNDFYLLFDRADRPKDSEPARGDGRALASAVTVLELRVR